MVAICRGELSSQLLRSGCVQVHRGSLHCCSTPPALPRRSLFTHPSLSADSEIEDNRDRQSRLATIFAEVCSGVTGISGAGT